jgi:hypothetical protein
MGSTAVIGLQSGYLRSSDGAYPRGNPTVVQVRQASFAEVLFAEQAPKQRYRADT